MTEEQFKGLKEDVQATISSDFFDNDVEFGLYVLGITDTLTHVGSTHMEVVGVETLCNHFWASRKYWDKDFKDYVGNKNK